MRIWPLIVSLLVLAGCTSRPDDVLSRREMTRLLVELHKADGIIYVAGKQYGYSEEKTVCYQNVLNSHHITQAQFDSSLIWYTANPKIFEKIYVDVLAELEQEIAKVKVPAKIPDNITCPDKTYWDKICPARIDTLPDTNKRWLYLILDSCSYMEAFEDTTTLLLPYIAAEKETKESTTKKEFRKFILKQ